MTPFSCLYIMDPADNVATALADLKAGQVVPVLDPNGNPHGELVMRSHAPRFFKVTLKDLADGTPIIKWGRAIGRVPVASECSPSKSRPAQAGTVAHFTNFIPARKLVSHWGDHLASPSSRLLEAYWKTGGREPYPFEFARSKVTLLRGSRIFDNDLEFSPGAKEVFLPEKEGEDEEILVGYAIETISPGTKLHLGCIVPQSGFFFEVDRLQVENVQAFYRFLKGRIHGI